MVSPETIIFAVRALVRVGGAARASYEQKVRDSDVIMPLPPQRDMEPLDYIRLTFEDSRYRGLVRTGGRLAEHWDAAARRPADDPESQRIIVGAAEEIWETDLAKPRAQWYGGARRQEEAGFLVLSQWAEGSEPPPPLARVVVAIADVAIEYVGAYPELLGVGSNGERLISAMARNLHTLLPDADDPKDWPPGRWSRFYFIERAATIFASASLRTLSEHPNLVVDEVHFQDLLGNVLNPLVEKLDEDPTRAPSLITLRDTLLGPMASAALSTVASHQERFLGRGFAVDQAAGAVTSALLEEAAESGDVRVVFSEQGMVGLYQAALGVAVDRPELFVGEGVEESALIRKYLSGAAGLLRQAPPPYDKELAAGLGVLALELAGEYATISLDPEDSWEALSQAAIASFLGGVRAGVAAGGVDGALAALLSREQLSDFARIFFEQAARTPGMLTGAGGGQAVQNLVAGVAASMSKRGADLLSGDDWLLLAAIASREAARNPGRLFGLDPADPDEQLGTRAIELVLSTAADAFENGGLAGGTVFFGETLRQALELTLDAVLQNVEGAAEHLDEVASLFARINALTAARPQRVGADGALSLVMALAEAVVEQGTVPILRDDGVVAVAVALLTDDELIDLISSHGGPA